MEKSWNMKNLPKVMEFCYSIMEFYQFCPQIVPNLDVFFFHYQKLRVNVESSHFTAFSAKRRECKIMEN